MSKCFLVEGSDRREETLRDISIQWVVSGTHIISDGWRAYNNIEQWSDSIYTQSVIVHEQNFIDPQDPEVHTQNVEDLWMRAKRKICRQLGTSNALFPSYLHEFIWHNSILDKTDTFPYLLTVRGMYWF